MGLLLSTSCFVIQKFSFLLHDCLQEHDFANHEMQAVEETLHDKGSRGLRWASKDGNP